MYHVRWPQRNLFPPPLPRLILRGTSAVCQVCASPVPGTGTQLQTGRWEGSDSDGVLIKQTATSHIYDMNSEGSYCYF